MTVKMTLDPFLGSNESYRRHMSDVDKVEAFEAFCIIPKNAACSVFPANAVHAHCS